MVGAKLKQIYKFGDQSCILIVHGAKYKMIYSLDFRVKKCNFHTQRKKKEKVLGPNSMPFSLVKINCDTVNQSN